MNKRIVQRLNELCFSTSVIIQIINKDHCYHSQQLRKNQNFCKNAVTNFSHYQTFICSPSIQEPEKCVKKARYVFLLSENLLECFIVFPGHSSSRTLLVNHRNKYILLRRCKHVYWPFLVVRLLPFDTFTVVLLKVRQVLS